MIGDNIRALLQEKGYTQNTLAEKSQCSVWAISRYINNVHTPGIKALQRIAAALGVTVDELRNSDIREKRGT